MRILLYLLNLLYIIIQAKEINNSSESLKYMQLNFKRNLTYPKELTPLSFFKTYFYNQLYVNIKVGSNKQEIPFYFYLQQFPLTIKSSNVIKGEVKGIFNESLSDSYKSFNKDTFSQGDLSEGVLSKDQFFFNDNIQPFIDFYLDKQSSASSHITEGGKIGFKIHPEYKESDKVSFISNLKESNLISSKIFSIKYDTKIIEEDEGTLIIGAFPHMINEAQYKEEYYEKSNAIQGFSGIDWLFKFNDINYNNYTYENEIEGYFYSEIGFIIGTEKFFNYLKGLDLWKKYFNEKKCHEQKFRIDDFEGNDINQRFLFEYTGYYCDKDVDVEKINIGEILFFVKRDNFNISFSDKDMWMEKDGYKYFMILQTQNYEHLWFFGKPFFKKYQMIFDCDNKIIGYYSKTFEDPAKNEEKSHSFIGYIIAIIILGIIIIVLIYFLIKCYFLLPRKNRANELTDDNYDYSGGNINE